MIVTLLKRLEQGFNKIIDLQQGMATIFLFLMMVIVTADVFGRNILNQPLKGSYELTEISAAFIVFFALAITHRRDEHIKINFLLEKIPEKIRLVFYAMIEIIISIVLLLMAKQLFANGLRMMERNSATTDLGLPVYPFLFLISITLLTFMITAMYKAIRYFRQVVKSS